MAARYPRRTKTSANAGWYRSPAHLAENLAAAALRLSEDEMTRFRTVPPPES
jgi:aryl-alcohol dehydrogenase-like predicted oxidoreductase